jgi:hypothetical protein
MPDSTNSTKTGHKPDSTPDARQECTGDRPVSVEFVRKKWNVDFPFTIAAPSFVLPAGVGENSLFLADYFPEIALLFFEADACLAYTDDNLPPALADLDCTWHVHMPLDLDWNEGLDPVWRKIDGLLDKAAFLAPRGHVLHPPTAPDMLLPLAARLRDKGMDPALFLIENIRGYSLTPIWEEIVEGGFSTCLDIGHILAYDQFDVLDLPGLWPTVRMLHVYGGEKRMQHHPLPRLDKAGRKLLRTLLAQAPDATVTLEVFNEKGLFQSLDQLGQWLASWRDEK